MRLTQHRTKAPHLPHEPLFNRHPVPLAFAIEQPCFAGQILQDRPAFKNRNWFAVWTIRIHNRWHTVVWRDLQEIRFELLTCADIDQIDLVRQLHLFKCDGDFPAVGRGPVVKLYRVRHSLSFRVCNTGAQV